jgi:hypothetical protein
LLVYMYERMDTKWGNHYALINAVNYDVDIHR